MPVGRVSAINARHSSIRRAQAMERRVQALYPHVSATRPESTATQLAAAAAHLPDCELFECELVVGLEASHGHPCGTAVVSCYRVTNPLHEVVVFVVVVTATVHIDDI